MQSIRPWIRTVCLVSSCSTAIALAQPDTDSPAASKPETFGTSTIAHTLQAYIFEPLTPFVGATNANAFGSRYCTEMGGCSLQASLLLPAGAIIDSVVVDGCDESGVANLSVTLIRIGTGESSNTMMASVASSGSPGCTLLTATPAAHTIDNVEFAYRVEIGMPVATQQVRFQAVRVMYSLQVSPTPVTATFTDVPVGHPFHRFVEALVAAGITAGVAPGTYGVDDSITRGQMAVFLAVALGLHWAP
jgi:hypothetical protein